jgi:hypothetical protein
MEEDRKRAFVKETGEREIRKRENMEKLKKKRGTREKIEITREEKKEL